jgi:hypothetical protein
MHLCVTVETQAHAFRKFKRNTAGTFLESPAVANIEGFGRWVEVMSRQAALRLLAACSAPVGSEQPKKRFDSLDPLPIIPPNDLDVLCLRFRVFPEPSTLVFAMVRPSCFWVFAWHHNLLGWL